MLLKTVGSLKLSDHRLAKTRLARSYVILRLEESACQK
jgi:hypothetical protein